MVDRGEDESREEAADVEAGRAVDGELGVDDLDEALLLIDHDATGMEVAVAERAVLGHLEKFHNPRIHDKSKIRQVRYKFSRKIPLRCMPSSTSPPLP